MAIAIISLIIFQTFFHVQSYSEPEIRTLSIRTETTAATATSKSYHIIQSRLDLKSVTSYCKFKVSGNPWKKFTTEQQRDMVQVIHIHNKVDKNVEQDWFWAHNTQEPFLIFCALFHMMFDFNSNMVISYAIGKINFDMKALPKDCLIKINKTTLYRMVANVLLSQVTNQTGIVCHMQALENATSSLSFTAYQRLCCRMIMRNPNDMTCDNDIVRNAWLGIFSLIWATLLILLVLYCPALLFFVRLPFDYSRSGIRLIRLSSPANPVTMNILRVLCFLWPQGDSRTAKTARALLTIFIAPTVIITGTVHLLPSDPSWMSFSDTSNIFARTFHPAPYLAVCIGLSALLLLYHFTLLFLSNEETRMSILKENGKLLLNPCSNMKFILLSTLHFSVIYFNLLISVITSLFRYTRRSWYSDKRTFVLLILLLPCALAEIFFISMVIFVHISTIFFIPVTSLVSSFPIVAFALFVCLRSLTDFFVTFYSQDIGLGRFILFFLLMEFLVIIYVVCLPIILAYIITVCVSQSIYTFVAVILYLNDFLPYMTFIIITLALLWSCYNNMTIEYLGLRLLLFKACLEESETSQNVQGSNQLIFLDEDKVPRIPYKLDCAVCSEILPVGKTVGLFILKFFSTALLFLFTFACIMAFGNSQDHKSTITPLIQSIVTLLIGTLPKIASLFLGNGTMNQLEDIRAKSRLDHFVREYVIGQPNARHLPNSRDPGQITILLQSFRERIRPRMRINRSEYQSII